MQLVIAILDKKNYVLRTTFVPVFSTPVTSVKLNGTKLSLGRVKKGLLPIFKLPKDKKLKSVSYSLKKGYKKDEVRVYRITDDDYDCFVYQKNMKLKHGDILALRYIPPKSTFAKRLFVYVQ